MPRPSPFFRLVFLVAATLAAIVQGRAQSVRWEPSGGSLARDQVSSLRLVFQDAEPKETPALPAPRDLIVEPNPARSEQSTFNVTFGSQATRQRTVTYTYRVRPARADGEVRLPAFTVETDAGPLTVPAATFTVAAATVGQSALPLEQIASARFTPPAAPIWAGEVFKLTHILDVDRRYATNSILAAPLQWTPSPLVAEEWSKPVGSEVSRNGQARLLVTHETRAIAPTATASLPLPSATQLVNLPTGSAAPFSLFGGSTFEQFTINTSPATLLVRPLPAPAPAGFTGAVGRFTLSGKVVPQEVVVGEPVTWTLTLEGTGNWPVIDRLPPRDLSRDFRVVTPRAQKTPVGSSLFDAALSEDLVLIPQKPGRVTLGPYTLTVFDPNTGAYATLRADPVTITIRPAPGALDPAAPAVSAPAQTGADPEQPLPAASPATPEALPSDPVPAGSLAAAPLADFPRGLLWTLPALLLPAALWLALAAAHARRHDPLRARREAHAALHRILARLEIADPTSPAGAEALLAWQRATAALFALESATPAARDLPDPLWSALWIESERALYRRATPLSGDWLAQARSAHAAATPPPRSVLAALRPAHLFARSAVLLVALLAGATLLVPSPAHAASAAESYAAGDFPAAEKAWREAVVAAPLAWPARHNLALALAQQGQWDAATAHAHVAALQAPLAPEPRRLLESVLPRASFRPAPPPTAARMLTARQWQQLGYAAALALLLLPATGYLAARYRPSFRAAATLGHFGLVLSLATLAACLVAVRAYGPSAHPDAVLVWRESTLRAVPTEAGEQQLTTDLPAGTVARTDKTFLGWRRLILPDGTTGWVRTESLVGLWRTP